MTKMFKLFTLLCVTSFLLVSCNKDEDLVTTPNVPTNNETVTPPSQNNSNQINAFASAVENDTIDCFVPTLPMTFAYEDGTTVTAETEADLDQIFAAEPYPWDFVYPVNLENPTTGETTTAANEESLFELLVACEEWDDEDGDWDDEGDWDDQGGCDSLDFQLGALACYDLQFPLGFVLEDGSTVTAADEDELFTLFTNGAEIEDFVYPITLIHVDDDTEHTANNEEEIAVLIEACGDFYDDGPQDEIVYLLTLASVGFDGAPIDDCYDYVYPVSVLNQDGETVTFNSDAEIGAIFETSTEDEYYTDFVYPVSVTVTATGETETAENPGDVYALLEACE